MFEVRGEIGIGSRFASFWIKKTKYGEEEKY